MLLNIIEQLPGYIAWKDSEHRYLGCNDNLAKVFGLANQQEIVGLADKDLGEYSEEVLKFYYDTDMAALSGKTVRVIHSIGAVDPNKSYLLIKKPLFDVEQQIIGTIYNCHESVAHNAFFALKKQDAHLYRDHAVLPQYQIDNNQNPLNLSARELECLFCILRGMTAQKTADAIKLSKRTVEFYIENIKNKFGCLSKTELLVSAIKQGYMNFIPPLFLNSDLQDLFS